MDKRFGSCEGRETLAGVNRSGSDLAGRPPERVARSEIFVHSCCGPCSTAVVERLAASYDVTLFFYNPNIDDEAEYRRRLEAQKQFVERFNASRKFLDTARVRLVVGPYEPQQFLCEVAGHEEDPEAGARCAICFRMRLFKTAEYAVLHGFSLFTTTLSVSPHKDAQLLAKIGTEAAFAYGISYLPEDFKKQNGFGRSAELARAYELYRQNYCGCTFSKR